MYIAQLEGIRDALTAGEDESLGALIRARSAEVADRIDESLDRAIADLSGLEGPLRTMAEEQPELLQPTYQDVAELRTLFESDVVSLLDITLGFSDTDGDTGDPRRPDGRGSDREIKAASGAVFRIGFGIVGVVLVVRFIGRGWIESLLVEPAYHYPYPGFEWVRVWPEPWMQVHFLVIGVAMLGIVFGYRYRLAAGLFAISLGYVELIDRTLYLNHYYWVVLTAEMMVFLPLNSAYSVDAARGRVVNPGWYSGWVVWALRFQVGMVYFFAGVAKLNGDWLLRAEPLATWLPARSELWLIGPVLTVPVARLCALLGRAFFDLTIVGWLSWRRTRPVAYIALVSFHTLTWLMFPSIGLFPLLMSLSALVFFDPAWPEPVSPPRPRRSERWAGVPPPKGGGGLRPAWVGVGALYPPC